MGPQRLTRATVRGGIVLALTLGALAGCEAEPENPGSAEPASAASQPVETSSPGSSWEPGGPKVERSPEEMALLRALDRAGLAEVGVPEHGAPGDAWAAGQLRSGHTGVLHSNRDRITTPGELVDELRVNGIPAEVRDTATFGPVILLNCRDFALEVATLHGFTPSGDTAEALELARRALPHLPC